jgi:hypothetical protein
MRTRLVQASIALWLLGGCAPPRPHDVEIVDARRNTLPRVERSGQMVYAGKLGEPYMVELSNNTDRPVAAAVTVDGLDRYLRTPADATPEGLKERGYAILTPHSYQDVPGFHLDDTRASSFRFVGPTDALASEHDRVSALGRIEVHFLAARSFPLPPAAERGPAPDAAPLSPPSLTLPESPTRRVFGELVTTSYAKVTERWEVDWSVPVLDHVVVLYEGANGSKLGTAGPPAIRPAVAATTPLPASPGDEEIAPATATGASADTTKGVHGGKPTKSETGKTPNASKPETTKTAKPETTKTAKPETAKTTKPETTKTAKPETPVASKAPASESKGEAPKPPAATKAPKPTTTSETPKPK